MAKTEFEYHIPPHVTQAEIDDAMHHLRDAEQKWNKLEKTDSHDAHAALQTGYKGFFRQLYAEKLPEEWRFDKLVKITESTSEARALGWICELALSKQLQRQDYAKLREYISALSDKRLDEDPKHGMALEEWKCPSIQQFPTKASLFHFVKNDLEGRSGMTDPTPERVRLIETGDIQIIHKADNITIYMPLTSEAAQVLGFGTQWCIAAKDSQWFDEYNQKGPLFIVFPKSERPIALHFSPPEFGDYADERLNWHELMQKFPVLQELAKEHLPKQKDPITEFLLNPHPSDLDLWRAICHDIKNMRAMLNEEDTTKSNSLKDKLCKIDDITPDTPAVRIGAAINSIRDAYSGATEYQTIVAREFLDEVDKKLSRFPAGPLLAFVTRLRQTEDPASQNVYETLIKPLALHEPETVFHQASINSVKGNYLSIQKYPDAPEDIQHIALETAIGALGRIQGKISAEDMGKSIARAVKAFSTLQTPIPEVTEWLQTHGHGRPAAGQKPVLPPDLSSLK